MAQIDFVLYAMICTPQLSESDLYGCTPENPVVQQLQLSESKKFHMYPLPIPLWDFGGPQNQLSEFHMYGSNMYAYIYLVHVR